MTTETITKNNMKIQATIVILVLVGQAFAGKRHDHTRGVTRHLQTLGQAAHNKHHASPREAGTERRTARKMRRLDTKMIVQDANL